MAGSYAGGRIGNSFLDEEDIDDEEFLRRSNVSGSGFGFSDNSFNRHSSPNTMSLEEQRQKILEKKRELEQMSIKSTERSLYSLRDTEKVGAATAEELYRQREQLEQTEKRLDDINTTLRFSERHIRGIKSVFGGLKNLISGKSGAVPSTVKSFDQSATSSQNSFVAVDRTTTQKKPDNSNHPGLRIRGLSDETEEVIPGNAQEIIDKNLDQMLSSIHRLKDLSYTLGDEIESQNDLIEKVIEKTERADVSIKKQNKDINRLLK